MQHMQHGVQGMRCLARTYGDTVLVTSLICAALAFAVLAADYLASAV